MSRALALVGGVVLAIAGSLALADDGAPPPAPRRAELARLVLQDCGSCHGMRLTGGLGPALTPDALRDKPRDSMVATILHGRPGTPMPPFRPFVSEAEASWIVDRLQEGQFHAP